MMESTLSRSAEVRPGFLAGRHGDLYVCEHVPWTGDVRRQVLVVPAFAEEMNRCRRMVHLAAQRLAELGFCAVVPDLSGTGDSDGEFETARWSHWLEDLGAVRTWMDARGATVALLAIRCGALLGAAHAATRPVERLVFWQPVLDGRDQLRDFLRVRALAERFRGAPGDAASVAELQRRLLEGEALTVAGYVLAPELARSLSEQNLARALAGRTAKLHWLEIAAGATEEPAPPVRSALDALRAQGCSIDVVRVTGPRFWTTPETTTAPALLDETARVFQG